MKYDDAIEQVKRWADMAAKVWDLSERSESEHGCMSQRSWSDECLERAHKWAIIAAALNPNT